MTNVRRHLVRYEVFIQDGSNISLEQTLDVDFDTTWGEWIARIPGEPEIVAHSVHSSCLGLEYMRHFLIGEEEENKIERT